MQPSANHTRFLSHLRDSELTRWMVAQWFNSRGYDVSVPPLTMAPTADKWKEHKDDGDLELRMRVEVKGLSAEFTSAADWPFGEKFIVCAKHAWDGAKPKPYAFIIVNAKRTHAACVMGQNAARWTVGTRTDSRYQGVSQEFYFSPMADVKFFPMVDPASN